MISDYRIDAVVLNRIELCVLFGTDSVINKNLAREINVPILSINREANGQSTGQIKTRLQAFYEIANNKKKTAGSRTIFSSGQLVR